MKDNNTAPATPTTTVQRSEGSGRTQPQPSADRQTLLPSAFLARKHLTTSSESSSKPKKRRVSGQVGKEKTYTKDIVCLLPQHYGLIPLNENSVIQIPRGKARGNLATLGLIGKVHLVSTWPSARVTEEITSVFSSTFGLEENEQLGYKYLAVVPGAKVLSLAKVSTSFSWSGHAVASLAGQGCIYILSEINLKERNITKEEPEDLIPINDSDSEPEVPYLFMLHSNTVTD